MDLSTGLTKKGLSIWMLLLIITLALPSYSSPYVILSVTSIYMYVTLAVSWTIFCAPTGYVSLATATFFGIGIYVLALLGKTFSLPVVILLGGVASLLFGILVGLICLRLSGFYFAVFTFGLSELIRNSMLWREHNITGTVGRWIPSASAGKVYYSMLIVVSITVLTSYLIGRSKYGLALKGIGESEEAAEHIGVNVTLHRIGLFAVSCFFMGMSGDSDGHEIFIH